MYEAFFRMQKRPFAATPVAGVFYPAAAIEAARQAVARCIERAEGPAVVLGPAGTGKSLLLARLAQEFASQFDVVHLAGGRISSVRALLQNVLFELKLPFRNLSEGELRLMLLDRLEPSGRSSHGLLLLVDEAHVLPTKLIDELRMITNLVRGGEPRVRLVLAGDVRLEERLANPRLASFQQRVAARCYLQSLNREETAGYVREQLTLAGAQPGEIVSDETLASIHRVSDGVPRLINQLCDHALILAQVAGERRLTCERIEEAWADLQQLPAPQRSTPAESKETSIIEFGSLDDDEPLPSARVTRIDAPVARHHESPSHDVLTRIDAIQRQVALANSDDFNPLSLQESELELSFEGPQHPFGGVFEEEEVVIDRYASLEAQTLRGAPRVSSSEGRAIATLMGTATPARRRLGIVSEEPTSDVAAVEVDAEMHEEAFDPAADPVMPEYAPAAHQQASQPELVVVDTAGDKHQTPAGDPPGRAHRQEYRQLFARLRRGG